MKWFGLILIATCLLAACGNDSPRPVQAEPVHLFPDNPDQLTLDQLIYTGGLVLTSQDPRFGGWSAIEISADGTRLLALSDSAYWMTADLVFDDGDNLSGLQNMVIAPLLDENGQPLSGAMRDAEGLAPLGDGHYLVSFEREHRLQVYDIGDDWSGIGTATAMAFPAPPGLNRLRDNGGVEALASLTDGVWAGIEYPIIDGQPHTVWKLTRTEQIAHTIRLSEGYGLTALARYNDHQVVAVERFWARDIGNRIRIVLLDDSDFQPGGAVIPDHETDILAEFTPEMTVDNFEGVAVTRLNGTNRLFLISDDNFSDDQRTLLLSFALP